MTEKHIKLLEQWRDWHWQLAIKVAHEGDTDMAVAYKIMAYTMDQIIKQFNGDTNCWLKGPISGYEQYKYGEWPE